MTAFDWNKVGGELEALGQAIADTIDPANPMQSNESTMDCLEHLWGLGYRVVPIVVRDERSAEVAALRLAIADVATELESRSMGLAAYVLLSRIESSDRAALAQTPPTDAGEQIVASRDGDVPTRGVTPGEGSEVRGVLGSPDHQGDSPGSPAPITEDALAAALAVALRTENDRPRGYRYTPRTDGQYRAIARDILAAIREGTR